MHLLQALTSVFPLQSPKASLTLVTPALLAHDLPPGRDRSPSHITSLCTPSPAARLDSLLAPTSTPTPLQVVSTTRDVMWLDERMPGKDLMRCRHGRLGKEGRGPDRSLGLIEVPSLDGADQVRRVALHSRVHAGVSVYTCSEAGAGPARSVLDPYVLPGPAPAGERFVRNGIALSPLDDESWLLNEAGVDGAVYSRTVTLEPDLTEADSPTIGRVWDSTTAKLAAAEEARVGPPQESASQVGNKQVREYKVLDLERSCQAVFKSRARLHKKKEEIESMSGATDGSEVVDALERAKDQLRRAVEVDEDLAGEAGAAGILTG